MVYYGHKGVAITSHGESASSEGYVYEAINGASREGLPVIFVWQDNGYGISVPKKDQTVARKKRKRRLWHGLLKPVNLP